MLSASSSSSPRLSSGGFHIHPTGNLMAFAHPRQNAPNESPSPCSSSFQFRRRRPAEFVLTPTTRWNAASRSLAMDPQKEECSRVGGKRTETRLFQATRSERDALNTTGMIPTTASIDDDRTMEDDELLVSFMEAELSSDASRILPTSSSYRQNSWSNMTMWKQTGMPTDAILGLNAVAIIWGSQHALIKLVVDDSDTSAFSLVRFALAAVVATTPQIWSRAVLRDGAAMPSFAAHQQRSSSFATPEQQLALTVRWGIEMGFWMFLGYAFQAVGLQSTTAQRSGFLLYLNVKFVPFFARILLGRTISIPTWCSALAAVLGTALLASDGSADMNFNKGDLWSIAAAATSAIFILRLESASKAVVNSAALNAACLWFVTLMALIWAIGQGVLDTQSLVLSLRQVSTNVLETLQRHLAELLYLSTVTTALATYIQTRAQKKVSAERASVIFALDPVYGALFSNVLLGEQLQGWGIVGAAIITLAAATNAFLDFGVDSGDSEEVVKPNGDSKR